MSILLPAASRARVLGVLSLLFATVLFCSAQQPAALAAPDTPGQMFGLTAALSAGETHTCGVASDAAVLCWGHGAEGRLGDGTLLDRSAPVPVQGLPTVGAINVSAGGGHTCALLNTGAVHCWGRNRSGQLGAGTVSSYAAALQVSGLSSGVSAISAGANHACAIIAGGAAKCWGANDRGQLGTNNNTQSSQPVSVQGLGPVSAISAGGEHTCARETTGGVKCWGRNDFGQLGIGSTVDALLPQNVSGLASDVSAITAGGQHSCAIRSGAAWCWGNNVEGAVGNAGSGATLIPVAVVGLGAGVAMLSAGARHSCARSTAGALKCWGNNAFGMLGDGTQTNRFSPVDVSGAASGFGLVSAGGDHTCALVGNGSARCWGNNAHGQLGNSSIGTSPSAAVVSGLASGVMSLAAGDQHACALMLAGNIKCWGRNDHGQLGDGTLQHAQTPVDVQTLFGPFTTITAGANHTCAIANSGLVHCWGDNRRGQLGNGNTTSLMTPGTVQGITAAALMSAGADHGCARDTAFVLKCWGDNAFGQLGNNLVVFSSIPMDVTANLHLVYAIATGGQHSCALSVEITGGFPDVDVVYRTFCWGRNDSGQLGNGGTVGGPIPMEIASLAVLMNGITAGATHSCALPSDRPAVCWGNNAHGQVGNGLPGPLVLSPVPVFGLSSSLLSIDAGGEHSCVITKPMPDVLQGGLNCWGRNANGQLGDNTFVDASTPIAVLNMSSGISQVVAGFAFTCANVSTGGALCWGDDGFGQLGNNLAWHLLPQVVTRFVALPSPTPTPISTLVKTPTSTPGTFPKTRLYLPIVRRDPPPAPTPTPTASPTPIPCYQPDGETEPNNLAAQADGPLCSGKLYTGIPNDAKDYWSVDVPANASMTVVYQNQTGGNRAFTIFRPDGSDLEYVPDTPQNYSRTFANLPAGRYLIYFNVGSGWNNVPYTLRVTFP